MSIQFIVSEKIEFKNYTIIYYNRDLQDFINLK